MRCIVCKKKIYAGTCHDEVWLEMDGKMVKVPSSRFRGAVGGAVSEGFHTCMNHVDDPKGDRCSDKLERGEFE
jgi:hypothetical protein